MPVWSQGGLAALGQWAQGYAHLCMTAHAEVARASEDLAMKCHDAARRLGDLRDTFLELQQANRPAEAAEILIWRWHMAAKLDIAGFNEEAIVRGLPKLLLPLIEPPEPC